MKPSASSSTSSSSSSSSSGSSSSSSGASTDSSSTATGSASSSSDEPWTGADAPTDSEQAEHAEHVAAKQHESRLASIAARHIQVPHLDRVLDHVSKHINARLKSGELTGEQLNSWSDADWGRVFSDVAKQNPGLAVPLARPKLPTIKRRNPY